MIQNLKNSSKIQVLVFFFMVPFINLKSQEFQWKKADIEFFGRKCIYADLIVSDGDKVIYILQNKDNYVFSFHNYVNGENDWFGGDSRNIDENVEKILSIYIEKNRFYILVKYTDGSQRLIKQTRISKNDWDDYTMQYYNKFKFGGDTIIEPNMMIQTREAITDNPDTTIIMYSMKPGESRQYQIHRFDSYGDYEVFGIINPNRSKTLPDDTNYDVNIASNTFDNYTYCGFTADSTYASYSTNNYFQNGSSKFTSNYRGFTLVSEGNKELLTARIKFSIYNYNDDNPLNYFRLDAIDGYKNSKNEIIDKQFLSKYFTYDSLTVDSISRDWRRTVYEFDSKVEFVSDFFEFNNKYIILVKDEEANVSLMYSDNRCEKWIKISTPEFNNAGFLKFCYFNKQIYAYNSENLFVTDVASSVGIVSKNEVDIVAYAGNNVLFVKSNENNIRQICLFDILGKEIYSGNFNNNMELKIPINLINYNLLICQVKTQNEVKVLKLIKGEK